MQTFSCEELCQAPYTDRTEELHPDRRRRRMVATLRRAATPRQRQQMNLHLPARSPPSGGLEIPLLSQLAGGRASWCQLRPRPPAITSTWCDRSSP